MFYYYNFIFNKINDFFVFILVNLNNNFNMDIILSFILKNKYFLIFFIYIYICILLDKTFKKKNKIFILFYFIFIFFFLILLKGSFLVNEIFWYTLVLNGSFIFHVCICDWLYRLCIYYNCDYLSFLITRISFLFSLSFLLYLLHIIHLEVSFFYENSRLNKKFWFLMFINVIKIIIYICLLILIFFVSLFINYSLLLKGQRNNNINIKKIIYIFLFILLTTLISILILGIPRLYFIWIVLILLYIYKLLKLNDYNLIYIYFNLFFILESDFTNRIIIIAKDYNNINTKGFSYGFIEFIDYTFVFKNDFNEEFHLKCPFLYYSRKMLLLTYFRSYFKSIISCNKSISEYNYNCIFRKAFIDLNLNYNEIEYLDKKFKKIYKKTLNIC